MALAVPTLAAAAVIVPTGAAGALSGLLGGGPAEAAKASPDLEPVGATVEEQAGGSESDRSSQASRAGFRLQVAAQVKISPAKPPKPKAPAVPDWLQNCDPDATSNYGNGQIPRRALCALPDGKGELRADAALGYWKLDQEFRKQFGEPLCITDSYRSLDSQYRLAAAKPGLAARPGTSNHGWGIALDLCGGIESAYSAEHEWFLGNAPAFGWHLPAWARPGGSRPEPWHWEYDAG